MSITNDKLKSLTPNSVWLFTKQDTDFDESFKATKLFAEIKDKNSTNIEQYFSQNHLKYDINTDRHRMLVISQFYGLITKTPFFVRGGNYSKEAPTEIYDMYKNCEINSREYNVFKTEQLLKIKFHAIIDTAHNNEDYNILPIVFIYKVLKILKEKYGINEITEDQLYTYVLTCKSYKELDDAVEYIRNNESISTYVDTYKSRSRVLTFIRNNIKLFNISNSKISINPVFDNYFNNHFIQKYDFIDLHEQLLRDVDYSYFLYNNQNFNINLIDEPTKQEQTEIENEKIIISSYIDDDENESDYIEKVDNIDEKNINEDVCQDAYKVEPVAITKFDKKRRFRTNPLLGKIAIKKSYYQCEKDFNHHTFPSKKTNKSYMEAHHLIPVCYQKEIWGKYHVNIDCVENLVSLCPTCHKAFHFGTNEVKNKMIEEVFKICAPKYHAIGLNISIDEIKKLYKL